MFSEENQWRGWTGNTFIMATAGSDYKIGFAGVQLQVLTETQAVSPISGVLGPGTLHNGTEVLVTPNVKGSPKAISCSGPIITFQLVGTTTTYRFDVATYSFVS